jgi:hypothetical protein
MRGHAEQVRSTNAKQRETDKMLVELKKISTDHGKATTKLSANVQTALQLNDKVVEAQRKVTQVDARFRPLEQGVQGAIEQFREIADLKHLLRDLQQQAAQAESRLDGLDTLTERAARAEEAAQEQAARVEDLGVALEDETRAREASDRETGRLRRALGMVSAEDALAARRGSAAGLGEEELRVGVVEELAARVRALADEHAGLRGELARVDALERGARETARELRGLARAGGVQIGAAGADEDAGDGRPHLSQLREEVRELREHVRELAARVPAGPAARSAAAPADEPGGAGIGTAAEGEACERRGSGGAGGEGAGAERDGAGPARQARAEAPATADALAAEGNGESGAGDQRGAAEGAAATGLARRTNSAVSRAPAGGGPPAPAEAAPGARDGDGKAPSTEAFLLMFNEVRPLFVRSLSIGDSRRRASRRADRAPSDASGPLMRAERRRWGSCARRSR